MFADIGETELQTLIRNKDSKSTQNIVKRSVKLFRTFLAQRNVEVEFESLAKPLLNENLRVFFASVRNKSGGSLKVSSLQSIKYGITKYLKETCKIDVSTDPEFADCMQIMKATLTDMKKKGHGSVDHKPPISANDLKKLYSSENLAFNINTPTGLQMKVWFDLMFFLCRRGRENLRNMTKSTYKVDEDSSGREFVYQAIDEADKNHRYFVLIFKKKSLQMSIHVFYPQQYFTLAILHILVYFLKS